MNESDFWVHLEFRVCRELSGLCEKELRSLWCDGFIPEQYLIDPPTPHIMGRAWFGRGSKDQEQWEFALFLDKGIVSRSDIDWASLLPPEDVTRWLAIDSDHKRMQIEPSAAVADSEHQAIGGSR